MTNEQLRKLDTLIGWTEEDSSATVNLRVEDAKSLLKAIYDRDDIIHDLTLDKNGEAFTAAERGRLIQMLHQLHNDYEETAKKAREDGDNRHAEDNKLVANVIFQICTRFGNFSAPLPPAQLRQELYGAMEDNERIKQLLEETSRRLVDVTSKSL